MVDYLMQELSHCGLNKEWNHFIKRHFLRGIPTWKLWDLQSRVRIGLLCKELATCIGGCYSARCMQGQAPASMTPNGIRRVEKTEE